MDCFVLTGLNWIPFCAEFCLIKFVLCMLLIISIKSIFLNSCFITENKNPPIPILEYVGLPCWSHPIVGDRNTPVSPLLNKQVMGLSPK